VIKIEHFAGVDDYREYLNAPWRRGGKLYATNGHFMVEIDDDGREAADFSKQPDCAALFVKHSPGDFVSLPELPAAVTCRACDGAGMCYREGCPDCDAKGEFTHGMYEYQCQRCDGDGYFTQYFAPEGESLSRCVACYGLGEEVNRDHRTKVGTRNYATRLLRVLTALPGVEVSCCPTSGNPLWFRFDGGRGLVMPMHD
jgi:hypothetical protein